MTGGDGGHPYTRPVLLFYERLAGRRIGADEWRALDDVFHDSYHGRLDRLGLAPGARAALEAAERAGLTQSLLSMWRHQQLVPMVERLGIGHFFLRVDGLRVPGGESKTAHLVEHLAAVGVPAGAALLVGDSLDDLAAARAVGAGCVLYDGGSHHRQVLEATGAPVVEHLGAALQAGLQAGTALQADAALQAGAAESREPRPEGRGPGPLRPAPGRRPGSAPRRPAR